MSKRLLIVISSYRWGGINVALQNFLNKIDTEEYKVDLFVTVHSGSYVNSFNNCNILEKDYLLDALIDHASLKHGLTKLVSIALKVLNRLTQERLQFFLYERAGKKLLRLQKYCAVIGWHEGVPTSFVAHMEHENKIAWVHCDYANYDIAGRERNLYERLNKIICVSNYTKNTFVSIYPDFIDKVYAIYNVLDVESIRTKAVEGDASDMLRQSFSIVSVGRVSPVKRFCLIPEIAAKLLGRGCDFCWYIVGPTYPGEEYERLMSGIDKYGLKDRVVLLGEKTNPYSYIAKAHLLVSTSLSEALPFVVNEAKTLGVPVVSTDYGSASELLPASQISPIETIHELISDIILDKLKYKELVELARKFEYDNDSIIKTIEALF